MLVANAGSVLYGHPLHCEAVDPSQVFKEENQHFQEPS